MTVCFSIQFCVQYNSRLSISQLLSEIMLSEIHFYLALRKRTVMHQWRAGSELRLCSIWLAAWSKKRPHFTIASQMPRVPTRSAGHDHDITASQRKAAHKICISGI